MCRSSHTYKFTNKEKKFVWEQAKKESFNKIKTVVAETVMTTYPDRYWPFILYTDLSDTQIGGLLVWVDPNTNEETSILTFSQNLNTAELNQPITN